MHSLNMVCQLLCVRLPFLKSRLFPSQPVCLFVWGLLGLAKWLFERFIQLISSRELETENMHGQDFRKLYPVPPHPHQIFRSCKTRFSTVFSWDYSFQALLIWTICYHSLGLISTVCKVKTLRTLRTTFSLQNSDPDLSFSSESTIGGMTKYF